MKCGASTTGITCRLLRPASCIRDEETTIITVSNSITARLPTTVVAQPGTARSVASRNTDAVMMPNRENAENTAAAARMRTKITSV